MPACPPVRLTAMKTSMSKSTSAILLTCRPVYLSTCIYVHLSSSMSMPMSKFVYILLSLWQPVDLSACTGPTMYFFNVETCLNYFQSYSICNIYLIYRKFLLITIPFQQKTICVAVKYFHITLNNAIRYNIPQWYWVQMLPEKDYAWNFEEYPTTHFWKSGKTVLNNFLDTDWKQYNPFWALWLCKDVFTCCKPVKLFLLF